MLSTSILSFSPKLPQEEEEEEASLNHRIYPRPDHHHHNYSNTSHHHVTPSMSSESLGSTLNCIKVKYLGCVHCSGKANILKKGITCIQSELLQLYSTAQRKHLNNVGHYSANGSIDSYQLVEICNYGIVVAEADPTARTTLDISGSANSSSQGKMVVTKVITPLSNTILWAAIRFNSRVIKVKGKRYLGAAFIPLSCSSAVFKRNFFTRLSAKQKFLVSLSSHPPLFLCVLRKVSSPKTFESHLFACGSNEDAMSLCSNLADIHHGISRVGVLSLPVPGDMGSYSYKSFGESMLGSRTSSRVNGTASGGPSLLSETTTTATTNTTVNGDRNKTTRRTIGLEARSISPVPACDRHCRPIRSEMINYRRDLGLNRWHGNASHHHHHHHHHNRSSSDLLIKSESPPINGTQCCNGSPIYCKISSRKIPSTGRHYDGHSEVGSSSSIREVTPSKISSSSKTPANCINNGHHKRPLKPSDYFQCQTFCQTCGCQNGLKSRRVNGSHHNGGSQGIPSQRSPDHNMNYYQQSDQIDGRARRPSVGTKCHHSSNCSKERIETNNYNGYVVHFKYDESLSETSGQSTGRVNGLDKTTLITSEDESLSKLGRRGQRLLGVGGPRLFDLYYSPVGGAGGRRYMNGIVGPKGSPQTIDQDSDRNSRTKGHFKGANGFERGEEDDHHHHANGHHHRLHDDDSDGLLSFVNQRYQENYPPLMPLNDSINLTPWNESSGLHDHRFRRHDRSKNGNNLLRKLGRWKLRSWVRKSFNLKFRRKKRKTPRSELLFDRELRYLSLAEPLDYIGDKKLGFPENSVAAHRLKLLDSTGSDSEPRGYFLGMEPPRKDLVILPQVEVTQEIPEERSDLENLRQILEQRKQHAPEMASLPVDLNKPKNGVKDGSKASHNKQTKGDRSLSQIDLLDELGYLP